MYEVKVLLPCTVLINDPDAELIGKAIESDFTGFKPVIPYEDLKQFLKKYATVDKYSFKEVTNV